MTTQIVTRHTDETGWRARNPLRAWRVASGTRATTVARRLGVTKIAIMHWEKGARTPRRGTWPALAALTGDSKIEARWSAWLAERECYTTAGGEA